MARIMIEAWHRPLGVGCLRLLLMNLEATKDWGNRFRLSLRCPGSQTGLWGIYSGLGRG